MKKILIKLLNKLGLVEVFNFTLETKVNSKTFQVPVIKRMGLENIYISEPWMILLLEKILSLKQGLAYVDVGVNIGQTLIKLKSVSPDIKYYGFEPNPACCYYINELVRVNKFKNVTLFPVGVSDKTSIYELSFFSEDEADSSASILKDFRPIQKTYRKEYIACFNASEIIGKYLIPAIGIIKIDVEGAEKEVIEGFKNRIIDDQPIIQLEILPVYNKDNKERLVRQEALEHFFRQINYTLLRIHTDEQGSFVGLEEIQTIGIHSNLNWCEYLVVPASMKANIQNIV